MVVPVTSTNWPATKWSAVISAPTGMTASSETRNSAILRFGSTLATAKWPRSALRDVLHLGLADADLQRGVAVLLLGAMRDHWHCRPSTVTGTCSPASVKMRVIPTFCAMTPERI